MAETVFEKLARSAPVNKQAALTARGKTTEAWNDDVIKYNAEQLRKQQQRAFEQVATSYCQELKVASHGNYYAKDYIGYARKKIREGKWTPGIDASAPKKWVGLNPKKARELAPRLAAGRAHKRARKEARMLAALREVCPAMVEDQHV